MCPPNKDLMNGTSAYVTRTPKVAPTWLNDPVTWITQSVSAFLRKGYTQYEGIFCIKTIEFTHSKQRPLAYLKKTIPCKLVE